MAPDLKYKAGDKIGRWKLITPLGQGGNAEVWEAADDDSRIAIKIPKSTKPNSEPYKRFKAEADLLMQLGERPGILYAIDAFVPDNPSRDNPAWLLMPVATRIDVALGKEPSLESVVEAMAQIAQTLANLAKEGISHRDIKPDNIFLHDGQWVLGDFGLADYPDKEVITEEGKPVGSRHYTPHEMISNPRDADSEKVDVYSFAKTLWVLATGQNYPLEGEQRLDNPQVGIAANYDNHKARHLDWLIERMTRFRPEDRPTMAEVASELRAWLAPGQQINSPDDVSDIARRIAIKTEPSSSANRRKMLLIEEARQYPERFRDVLEKVGSAFASTDLSDGDIKRDWHVFRPLSMFYGISLSREKWEQNHRDPIDYVIWHDGLKVTALTPGRDYPDTKNIEMISGVQVNLYEDEELEIAVGYQFHFFHALPPDLPYKDFISWGRAPVGSVKVENFIPRLKNRLIGNLRPALEYYAKLVEVLPFS